MKWFCFKFWFYYRLFMACLQHFNWCVSIYTNCVYFTLWKSYDLLWFWMHITLCSCFPQLRRENYLLVWCNLIKKKYTTYPKHTYKQIYLMLYGGPGTKAEAALENIEEKERHEREDRLSRRTRRRQSRERARRGQPVPAADLEESSSDSDGDDERQTAIQLSPRTHMPDVIKEEEEECRKYVYVGDAVEDSNKDLESMGAVPIAPPRASRQQELIIENGQPTFALTSLDEDVEADRDGGAPGEVVREGPKAEEGAGSDEESDTNSTSRWIDKVPGVPRVIRNRFRRSGSHQSPPDAPSPPPPAPAPWVPPQDADSVSVSSAWSRLRGAISNVSMPSMPRFNRSVSNDQSQNSNQIDILRPDFTNTYDILDPKKAARRQKRDRKELTKKVRKRIKGELREAARKERQRRMVTDAIELILQLLRMMTSFAVLVGNIRKTFIPAQIRYLKPGQSASDRQWLLFVFRVTTFMDVTMFSLNFLWVYCLQWHLCCRLGLVRFWFWTGFLITVAVSTMLYPMSLAMGEMDLSWCNFKNGSSLSKYQPTWH